METVERTQAPREYPAMLTALYAVKRNLPDGSREHMPAFVWEADAWSYAAVIRGAYVERVTV